MKAMIEGIWHDDIIDTPALRAARMAEKQRYFRGRVSADGSSGFAAEPGRYHLYVSYACPWAHRTILYRALKGLEQVISMSVADPVWSGPGGWVFKAGPRSTIDEVNGFNFLHQAYKAAKPDFTGKVTVPALWDKATKTIVSNESGEIIRMFDGAFDPGAERDQRYYPDDMAVEIDALNAVLLGDVCMGVYKAGFASAQNDYDAAVVKLFETLDVLEQRLAGRRFLFGKRIVESDWHLFTTLVRFDAVYHARLKCSIRRLIDYPNLSRYVRRLYDVPGVADTVKLDHVKRHYYDDLGIGDPRIIPADPALDFRTAA